MTHTNARPAYLGNDETTKPFASFIDAGCNLWRNFIDMGPTTGYMKGILEHFGNYSTWYVQLLPILSILYFLIYLLHYLRRYIYCYINMGKGLLLLD